MLMPNIEIGLVGEHRRAVTADIAVDFLGLEGARVLGTPFMIMLIEMTARNAMLPLLDPGYDSVADGGMRPPSGGDADRDGGDVQDRGDRGGGSSRAV